MRNSDCVTGFCNSGVCELTSCEDLLRNGVETDVDCGGSYCSKCDMGGVCIEDTDCATGYCDRINKICINAPACANKKLDEGETDIDCGGSCEPCIEGKTCIEDSDCEGILHCGLDKVCTSKSEDSDNDRVPDNKDICPDTPETEKADESGCSPSQKFSLNDAISDGWRLKFFNCITCPEAATDSDPDKDGLTNLEEFTQGTNPVSSDTDNDGWSDSVELAKGFSPTNPASHPASILKYLLWIIFILLIVGGVAYGVFVVLQMKRKEKAEKTQREFYTESVEQKRQKPKELPAEMSKLRSFARAKEEKVREIDWIPVSEIKPKEKKAERQPAQKQTLQQLAKRAEAQPKKLSESERKKAIDKLRKTANYNEDQYEED